MDLLICPTPERTRPAPQKPPTPAQAIRPWLYRIKPDQYYRECIVDFPISQNAIKPHLEKALAERGWRISVVDRVDGNLWWDELWSIESIWAPFGFRIYIAFEFDDVWESLGVATEKPVTHHDTAWYARLYLDKTWKAEFPAFLADIDRIRDEAKGAMSE